LRLGQTLEAIVSRTKIRQTYLQAIEEEAKRRFLIVGRDDVPNDHFEELGKGTFESLAPKGPVEEGAEIELKLVEVGLYDVSVGVGKHEGLTVVVGNAAGLVGKKSKVRIERVMDGVAYATLLGGTAKADNPITAEGEAEKPTRKPPVKKGRTPEPEAEAEAEAVKVESEPETEEAEAETEPEAETKPEAETTAAGLVDRLGRPVRERDASWLAKLARDPNVCTPRPACDRAVSSAHWSGWQRALGCTVPTASRGIRHIGYRLLKRRRGDFRER
jgi:predicted RNA-binding protein with TRAM domain